MEVPIANLVLAYDLKELVSLYRPTCGVTLCGRYWVLTGSSHCCQAASHCCTKSFHPVSFTVESLPVGITQPGAHIRDTNQGN